MRKERRLKEPKQSEERSAVQDRKPSARKRRHPTDAYPIDAQIGTPPLPADMDEDESEG
jgi:hypothetical protein